MKPGIKRLQAALPKIPHSCQAFSGESWLHSLKSWNRFVARLSQHRGQTLQILLEANDEISAKEVTMKLVHDEIEPFLKRMMGNPSQCFEYNLQNVLFFQCVNAYSVTLEIFMQQKTPKS